MRKGPKASFQKKTEGKESFVGIKFRKKMVKNVPCKLSLLAT